MCFVHSSFLVFIDCRTHGRLMDDSWASHGLLMDFAWLMMAHGSFHLPTTSSSFSSFPLETPLYYPFSPSLPAYNPLTFTFQANSSPYDKEIGTKEMNNLYPILAFLDGVSSSSSSLEMASVRSMKVLLTMGFLLVVVVVDGLLVVWSIGSVLKVGWGGSRLAVRGAAVLVSGLGSVLTLDLASALGSALMKWLLDLDSSFGLTE
jgi:hypothetical protein